MIQDCIAAECGDADRAILEPCTRWPSPLLKELPER